MCQQAEFQGNGVRRLRILVAHKVSRAPNGGMSRLMTFIHERLSQRSGHTIDYLCEEDLPRRWNGKLSRFSFPLLVYRKAKIAAERNVPYDVVNVHEPSSAAIAVLKKQAGNPAVVVTSYGIERRAWQLACEERRLGRDGPSWKSRLVYPPTTLWQSAVGLRLADHVVCSNAEDKQYLIERFRLPQNKITRMHSAADLIFNEASRGRNYDRALTLLFAATWRKNKGIEDLVPAFTALATRHLQLKLMVLGGGAPDDSIRNAFTEPARSRIFCVQAGSDAETAGWFARADIFVLPSLFEGTPLTLIEAMMSGLPVITTNTCGMKDVIKHEQNGLLIPIRTPDAIVDAVQQLLGDSGLRERLGRQAQRDALEKYTWEKVARPIEDVYEQLRAERG